MTTEHFPGIFRRLYDPPLKCGWWRFPKDVRFVSAEEMDGISEVWYGLNDGDASVALFPVGIVYIDWEEPA